MLCHILRLLYIYSLPCTVACYCQHEVATSSYWHGKEIGNTFRMRHTEWLSMWCGGYLFIILILQWGRWGFFDTKIEDLMFLHKCNHSCDHRAKISTHSLTTLVWVRNKIIATLQTRMMKIFREVDLVSSWSVMWQTICGQISNVKSLVIQVDTNWFCGYRMDFCGLWSTIYVKHFMLHPIQLICTTGISRGSFWMPFTTLAGSCHSLWITVYSMWH